MFPRNVVFSSKMAEISKISVDVDPQKSQNLPNTGQNVGRIFIKKCLFFLEVSWAYWTTKKCFGSWKIILNNYFGHFFWAIFWTSVLDDFFGQFFLNNFSTIISPKIVQKTRPKKISQKQNRPKKSKIYPCSPLSCRNRTTWAIFRTSTTDLQLDWVWPWTFRMYNHQFLAKIHLSVNVWLL